MAESKGSWEPCWTVKVWLDGMRWDCKFETDAQIGAFD